MTHGLLLATLLLAACGGPSATPEAGDGAPAPHGAKAPAPVDQGGDATRIGADFTVQEVLPVGEVIAHPEGYVGKTVRLEGIVVDVCEMRGCWLTLGTDGGETLRVKVNDGEMVFPMSARGRSAQVEGQIASSELTVEDLIERGKHHAEEQGETFDPASVTGPQTVYTLRPTAVQIAS